MNPEYEHKLYCMSCGNHVRKEKDMSEEEQERLTDLMDTPVFDGWNCDSCHRKSNFWAWLWDKLYYWFVLKIDWLRVFWRE